jgi:hypothetical protein
LPAPDAARDLLGRLGVVPEDADAIVATMPTPERDPERWALLEEAHHRLTAGIGDDEDFLPTFAGPGPWGAWPDLPERFGVGGRLFYAHLFMAAVPDIRRWHDSQGIKPRVSWATLAEMGHNIETYRLMHGEHGFHFPAWFVLQFRGGIFRLGRLEFRRGKAPWWRPADVAATGAGFSVDDLVLDLHIPAAGPLTPAAVDASIAEAHAFFGRHFPRFDSPYGVCASWLLDPQLAEYLPADSNIVRFQRRFHLIPEPGFPGDASVMEFVFRRLDPDLDDLPQDSTLQRAIVAHIRSGREWKVRRGWCPL